VSIYGIGIDIVQIDRMIQSLDKYGEVFAKKILHVNELEHFRTSKLKERYLAKRFAAKEAFTKAFGTGIVKNITLPKIEVINNENGKPEIILHGSTKEQFDLQNIVLIHLSISDEKEYAIAQVILEK
jgi:holo-[acyl-carrier protein] synthase